MRRRLFANLALAVAISSLLALALANGYLRPLQLQSGDLLFRLKPDTSPRWTVLVAIDDRSLARWSSVNCPGDAAPWLAIKRAMALRLSTCAIA